MFAAKRLLGLNYRDPGVQADMKLWPFRVISGLADAPVYCGARTRARALALNPGSSFY